ncbi:MAG: AAA family ATPase, partial [Desulfovibrio sp.]|nr:AAA family ATPase [Desulfovibrio sp.]
MLELLRIRNLAFIEDMALDFGEGMNVLTGETGAGKSFILKALGFLLGERLSPDMVRPGSDRAQVEAVFAGKDGGELILRRELFASGRSRFFVNDSPKPQERARELKDSLVAYTSQHGQQKLLQPAYQNQIMEQTLDCPELLQERDRLKAQLEAKLEERRAIEARQASLAEMRDLLELRQAEIDKVKPQENEDEELEALRVRARQAQEAARDYDQALGYLYGDADAPGLLDMARTFHRHLERMAKADAGLEPSCEATGSFVQELQHLAGRLRQPPRLEDMPPDMDAVEERLFELSQLKRRLRRTLPQILALKDEIEEKISFLDQCALDIKR